MLETLTFVSLASMMIVITAAVPTTRELLTPLLTREWESSFNTFTSYLHTHTYTCILLTVPIHSTYQSSLCSHDNFCFYFDWTHQQILFVMILFSLWKWFSFLFLFSVCDALNYTHKFYTTGHKKWAILFLQFAVAGPLVWNSLPVNIHSASVSLQTFARRLTTHLLQRLWVQWGQFYFVL